MRTLTLALMITGAANAQAISTVAPVRYVTSASHITWSASGGSGDNGDTPICSAWANDGKKYCTRNDGNYHGTSFSIGIFELTATNPVTETFINGMSSFGTSGATGCMGDAAHTCKSGAIWFDGNVLYLNVFSQDNGSPWHTYKSAIIKSTDRGVTWTNWAHAQAGSGGSRADGDMCTGDQMTIASTIYNCVEWAPTGGDGDSTGKMGKLALIQLAQDGATVPAIAGVLNTYDYFLSDQGVDHPGCSPLPDCYNNDHNIYVHALMRSSDPMIPANWVHWDGVSTTSNPATWNAAPDSSVRIGPSAWLNNTTFSVSAIYSPDFKQFFMIGSSGDGTFPVASSPLPTGPWVSLSVTPSTSFCYGSQFANFILATYKVEVPGGRFRIGIASNGAASDGCWDYTTGVSFMDFNLPNARTGPAALILAGSPINRILVGGQSLSRGAHGAPVLTTSGPYGNFTLAGPTELGATFTPLIATNWGELGEAAQFTAGAALSALVPNFTTAWTDHGLDGASYLQIRRPLLYGTPAQTLGFTLARTCTTGRCSGMSPWGSLRHTDDALAAFQAVINRRPFRERAADRK